MSKRHASNYKNYLKSDDPYQGIPKTTKWRLKQRTSSLYQPVEENSLENDFKTDTSVQQASVENNTQLDLNEYVLFLYTFLYIYWRYNLKCIGV